jgi:hypothetical protein
MQHLVPHAIDDRERHRCAVIAGIDVDAKPLEAPVTRMIFLVMATFISPMFKNLVVPTGRLRLLQRRTWRRLRAFRPLR